MGKMKTIYNMFSGGCSTCYVAWHLMLTTNIGNWFEAKDIAIKLREEYELTINNGSDIDGNNK